MLDGKREGPPEAHGFVFGGMVESLANMEWRHGPHAKELAFGFSIINGVLWMKKGSFTVQCWKRSLHSPAWRGAHGKEENEAATFSAWSRSSTHCTHWRWKNEEEEARQQLTS
ncbi:hypothetical protein VIGAN_UM014100 [Vigna angularis var. angularis]|uniref:Uncharacterized protein n=1 Tax=Vigna angularis var. angularis TaxID=157739 RepID=A0A0S3TD99_PHAAN|nr:hypothetical protein VIGAN_UM014100 [Vigna angularis var. angularis]